MRFSFAAGAFLSAAVLTAACGCSAAGEPAGTSAVAAAAAAGSQHCLTSALRIKTAPGSGEAMDGDYWDLTFTNAGTASCTLYGYPGVSFLTSGHTPITAPAARADASPQQVTLAPGQTASAQLKTPNTGNLPQSTCHQAVTAFLRVYPANDTVSVFVPARIAVCAGRAPGGSVGAVVPGSHAGV